MRLCSRHPLVSTSGAFLQRRRIHDESSAIEKIPAYQSLQHLRRQPCNRKIGEFYCTPGNLDQKRCKSNYVKNDPNIEKEEDPSEYPNSEENDPSNEKEGDPYTFRDSEKNDPNSDTEDDPFDWLQYAAKAGKIDPKHSEEEKKEWLPFWTTPERDPNKSIYVQHKIGEKDCKPLRLYIPTEECMEEIGTFVAMMIMTTPDLDTYEVAPNKGDVIFLQGDLGAGKSVFARGFVRGAMGNWDVEVPSPTYLLSNTYFASEEKSSNQNLE
jgi:hypothetical protein